MVKKVKVTLSLICLFVGSSHCFGQTLPDFGPVFLQDEVARIDIQIHPDSLAEMLLDENLYSNHEYPANFVFTSSLDADSIENIGFRLRGNTSREAGKKSFKISFNTFVDGQDYRGLEKLNINGEHNDPSILRSRLCWDTYHALGIPSPRSSHVALYINNEYAGVFLNVEHIDEEFAERYFDHKYGNLYKCLYPANLQDLGEDPDAYKLDFFGRRVYELKTNTDQDDYSRLAAFIHFLNTASDSDLECKLHDYFDVSSYLQMAAIEVLTGHWDGYIFNNNNYYLFEDHYRDQVRWIPYDMDNTFGIDWFGEDWTGRNVYEWQMGSGERPLFERLMDNDYFRAQYTDHLRNAVNGVLAFDLVEQKLNAWQTMLAPYVELDPLYPLDYGFSYNDFLESDTEAFGGHVAYGILPYLASRLSSVENQMEDTPSASSLVATTQSLLQLDNQYTITAQVMLEPDIVAVEYYTEDVTLGSQEMFDDGLHSDGDAGDGLYGTILEGLNGDWIDYQIYIIKDGNESWLPCEKEEAWLTEDLLALSINEWAPQGSTYLDQDGDEDDWIELYHPGGMPLDLQFIYLSDTYKDLGRASLAGSSIFDWTVFWADEEMDEGSEHLNFKLKSPSESIILTIETDRGHRAVDWVDYEVPSDGSVQGRYPDGANNQVPLLETPNASNVLLTVKENVINGPFHLYPNPTQGTLYSETPIDFELFDVHGVLIKKGSKASTIELSQLPNGVYLVRSGSQSWKVILSR